MKIPARLFVIIALFNGGFVIGQSLSSIEKQVIYLSGTDYLNTTTWDFMCTNGRKSGVWTKIEVPSCWEQQGFGAYNYGRDYHIYGRDFKYADETGKYKYNFSVPYNWRDKEVFIVFEGSMTDTKVKINGQSVGAMHQGSFYRFTYNISDKLNFGSENTLEVNVDKMSANKSVNAAERYADYWIFGGIFRPVYLEAFPKEHIERVAIVAPASGDFKVDIFPKNFSSKKDIEVEISNPNNEVVGNTLIKAQKYDSVICAEIKVNNPQLWTAETPNMYKVKVRLKDRKKTIYQLTEKFGFRTIEVKHGDGIYINGQKVKMKGVNRHAFWPESGRCLSPEINFKDVKLIKEMNMNAVRCSHYPPDKEFLDYCDSLGLYVIDELAGWQSAYDTPVGEKLVREMVLRDVNHPSIIFWSNGNEGGHNKDLVDDFHIYDPSKRTVIHAHYRPGNAINGIDCNHYESYESCQKILADSLIYMPTEFLHSQNDGGAGAGLEDYWELFLKSKRSAGGFLWAFIDEGIVRTDQNNIVDVKGVYAPDGILGPYRENEGSFYAIKEIFSPIHITLNEIDESFNGYIPVENRYEFTNLAECKFSWELVKMNTPIDLAPGYKVLSKEIIAGTDIKPGEKGEIKLKLGDKLSDADALILRAIDQHSNLVMNWSWKLKSNDKILQSFMPEFKKDSVEVEQNDSIIILTANKISLIISKKDGSLISVRNHMNNFRNFGNGPVMVSGNALFKSIEYFKKTDASVIEVRYDGDLKFARWKMYPNGMVELNYEYSLQGEYNFTGISFAFPEDYVMSARWLGNGPYRVWKNRLKGGFYNVWQNTYNNTQTGYYPWLYPEFKGYYSNITWMELNTVEGKFLMASKEDDLFIRLFEFYSLPGIEPHPELPPGDISFLDNIPPSGTKMSTRINSRPEKLGPSSHKNKVNDTFNRTLYFYFSTLQ